MWMPEDAWLRCSWSLILEDNKFVGVSVSQSSILRSVTVDPRLHLPNLLLEFGQLDLVIVLIHGHGGGKGIAKLWTLTGSLHFSLIYLIQRLLETQNPLPRLEQDLTSVTGSRKHCCPCCLSRILLLRLVSHYSLMGRIDWLKLTKYQGPSSPS